MKFSKIAVVIFVLLFFSHAYAVCDGLSDSGGVPDERHFIVKGAKAGRVVDIYCTDDINTVNVVLKDYKSNKIFQKLLVNKGQQSLPATVADLNGDGFGDLIVITEWGSPNFSFKVWRFNPKINRLVQVLDYAGTSFVKISDNEFFVGTKGGADLWSYSIFSWNKKGMLIPMHFIEVSVGADCDCKYFSLVGGRQILLKDAGVIGKLKKYCDQSEEGIVTKYKNLLSPGSS